MWLFFITAGLLCAGVFAGWDLSIRLRLNDAGEKHVFWQGATLDYGKYLKLCKERQWAAWPVYVMPVFLLLGAALIVYGLSQNN